MPNVRGVLFLDYVRMIRSRKDLEWSSCITEEDRPYVVAPVDPETWYPMAVFERLGNAILKLIAYDEMELVRAWGYHSVDTLCRSEPNLLAPGDTVETLTRFRVLRSTFFDFEALQIPLLHVDEADIVIAYGMGSPAEEAASWQTLGFFQRLLELAGATDVTASFDQRVWAGDPRTLLRITWTP